MTTIDDAIANVLHWHGGAPLEESPNASRDFDPLAPWSDIPEDIRRDCETERGMAPPPRDCTRVGSCRGAEAASADALIAAEMAVSVARTERDEEAARAFESRDAGTLRTAALCLTGGPLHAELMAIRDKAIAVLEALEAAR